MLQLEQVNKRFLHNGEAVQVLQDISFTVPPGDFFCLLGPSGCGKTTLLRCIGGFEPISSGSIKLNNHSITAPGIDRIMVFQGFDQLFAWKTVAANIEYPLKINGLDRAQRKDRVRQYLSLVGLSDYARYYPHQLSGGMKQRTAIARALALEPRLLLMDEPFGNLDALTRHNLQQELLRIKDKLATTVLFVTHDIDEALVLGDRILIMTRNGQVRYFRQPLAKPRQPRMEGFAGMWGKIYDQLGES
jgi:NitT/TauT family transport system ATP-binding protein